MNRKRPTYQIDDDLTPADVAAEAERQGVDPLLAVSIAVNESAGNPRARSPKGARGLMQVMPETGRRRARQLGETYAPDDPRQNLRLGVAELKDLSDTFSTHDEVAAGYNAGKGAVQQHGGIPPFRETQNYVPKVRATYQQLEQRLGGGGTNQESAPSQSEDSRLTGPLPSPAPRSPQTTEAANLLNLGPAQQQMMQAELPQLLGRQRPRYTIDEEVGAPRLPVSASPAHAAAPPVSHPARITPPDTTDPLQGPPPDYDTFQLGTSTPAEAVEPVNARQVPATTPRPTGPAPSPDAPQATRYKFSVPVSNRGVFDSPAAIEDAFIASQAPQDREAARFLLGFVPEDEKGGKFERPVEPRYSRDRRSFEMEIAQPAWFTAGLAAYQRGGPGAALDAVRQRIATEAGFAELSGRQKALQDSQQQSYRELLDPTDPSQAGALGRIAAGEALGGAEQLGGNLAGLGGALAGRLGLGAVDRALTGFYQEQQQNQATEQAAAASQQQRAGLPDWAVSLTKGVGALPQFAGEVALGPGGLLAGRMLEGANRPLSESAMGMLTAPAEGIAFGALAAAGKPLGGETRAAVAANVLGRLGLKAAEGAAINTVATATRGERDPRVYQQQALVGGLLGLGLSALQVREGLRAWEAARSQPRDFSSEAPGDINRLIQKANSARGGWGANLRPEEWDALSFYLRQQAGGAGSAGDGGAPVTKLDPKLLKAAPPEMQPSLEVLPTLPPQTQEAAFQAAKESPEVSAAVEQHSRETFGATADEQAQQLAQLHQHAQTLAQAVQTGEQAAARDQEMLKQGYVPVAQQVVQAGQQAAAKLTELEALATQALAQHQQTTQFEEALHTAAGVELLAQQGQMPSLLGGLQKAKEAAQAKARQTVFETEGGGAVEAAPDLLKAVRAEGGIRAEGKGGLSGELAKLGQKEGGTTGLYNPKTGLELDEMRLRMVSEGLSKAETADDFVRELDEALGQQKTGKAAKYAELNAADAELAHYEEQARQAAEPPTPAQPEIGQSDFQRLMASQRETINELYDLSLKGARAQTLLEKLRNFATSEGIPPRHVNNLVASIQNYQMQQARGEDLRARYLKGAQVTKPDARPTPRQSQQAIERAERQSETQLRTHADTAPLTVRDLVERAVQAIDTMFEEAANRETLDRAARGDHEAQKAFQQSADEHGLDADTTRALIEARRAYNERPAGAAVPRGAEAGATRPSATARELDAGDLHLLGRNPAEVHAAHFDDYLGALEHLRNEEIRGRVVLEPWAQRSLEALLKTANEIRRGKVKTKEVKPKVERAPVEQPFSKTTPVAELGTKAEPPVQQAIAEAIDELAHEAATSPHNDLPEPSDKQKAAGNYQHGHLTLHGLDISIENPAGSTRSGVGPNGKPWSVEMQAHYGYVRSFRHEDAPGYNPTEGADGEQVDVYIGEHPESERVFIVDQVDAETGKFDEHKVILGATSKAEAIKLYDAHFSDQRGHERRGAVTEMSVAQFKDWLKDEDQTKPVGVVKEPHDMQAESQAVENLPSPTLDSTVLRSRKIAIGKLIPFNIQGNKADLLVKGLGALLERAAQGTRRTIDAFAGSGTYTHYLRSKGFGHQGDILNEYDPLRYITHKQLEDDAAAVAREAERTLADLRKLTYRIREGEPFSEQHERIRSQVADYFQERLAALIESGEDWRARGRSGAPVEMQDTPETAGLYLILQNQAFNFLPVQAEVADPRVDENQGAFDFRQRDIAEQKPRFKLPGFGVISNEGGKVGVFAHGRDRIEAAAQRAREVGRRMVGVEVRRGDGWELIRREAGAGDLVPVDTSYLNRAGAETSNYNQATAEDAIPAVYQQKVREYLLPAWERGAKLLITNNWESGVVASLRALGFRLLKAQRQGASREDVQAGGAAELIAINFDPKTGAVFERRGDVVSRQSPARPSRPTQQRGGAGVSPPTASAVAREPEGEAATSRGRGSPQSDRPMTQPALTESGTTALVDQADAAFLERLIREQGGEMPRANLVRESGLTRSRIAPAIESLKGQGRLTEVHGQLRVVGKSEAEASLGPLASRPIGDIFYSQLERTLDAKLPNKVTADQVRGILTNPQYGVKPAEVDWLGLEEWLTEHPRFTKAEVLEFVRANQVEVQEVVKGQGRGGIRDAAISGSVATLRSAGFDVAQNPDDAEHFAFLDRENGDVVQADEIRKYAERGEVAASVAEAAERVERYLQGGLHSDNANVLGGATKFSDRALPGAHEGSYRELLLTMPEASGKPIRRVSSGGMEYDEYPQSFKSTHFDEPNIIAHVRFNERTDADGARVLFIEELQADKGQEWRRLKGKIDAGNATEQERQRFDFLDKNFPFNKTEQWMGLAFKRILRYAAEHGYEKVAWTTGSQQSERYDLSKQIDSLDWTTTDGQTFSISAMKGGEAVIHKDHLTPTQLEDHVGKDAAQKIVDRSEEAVAEGGAQGTLAGLDLQVGGAGMAGFYDRMLPAFANKYAKKWNAKVGTTTIGEEPETHTEKAAYSIDDLKVDIVYNDEIDGWEARDADRELYETQRHGMARSATREGLVRLLERDLRDLNEPVTRTTTPKLPLISVHALPITPAMRESVMQGQPLFALRPRLTNTDPADSPRLAELTAKPATPSKPARFYTNDHGMAVLATVASHVFGKNYTGVDALTLTRAGAGQLVTGLRAYAKQETAHAEPLKALAETIQQQIAANPTQKAFWIVDDSAAHPEQLAKLETELDRQAARAGVHATVREERFHFSQIEVGGVTVALTGKTWAERAIPAKLKAWLLEAGYPDDPEILAAEIAAKIAANKLRDLGIRSEADEAAAYRWLGRYFERVAERHGEEALTQFGSLREPAHQSRMEAQANVEARRLQDDAARRDKAAQASEGGAGGGGGGSQRGGPGLPRRAGRWEGAHPGVHEKASREEIAAFEARPLPKENLGKGQPSLGPIRQPELGEMSDVGAMPTYQPSLGGPFKPEQGEFGPVAEMPRQQPPLSEDFIARQPLTLRGFIRQIPRAVQTQVFGGDWSFIFRQGGPIALNPLNVGRTLKAFYYAFHATGREAAARQGRLGALAVPYTRGAEWVRAQLEAWPEFHLATRAGLELALTSHPEEVYRDSLITQLPWVRRVEAGNEAALDYLRLSEFSRYVSAINKSSFSYNEKEAALRQAAEIVNTLTGRAALTNEQVKAVVRALNGWLSAPRLNLSRIKMTDPTWIAREFLRNRRVGARLAKDAAITIGFWAGAMLLGNLAGIWLVSTDPDDPDFAQIKIGNTRWDVAFGLRPLLRLYFKTGRYLGLLAKEPFGGASKKQRQEAGRKAATALGLWARTRLAPLAAYSADLWFGKNVIGEPVELQQAAHPLDKNSPYRRLAVPLIVNQTYDAAQQEGVKGVLKTVPFESVGVGVQTYQSKQKKRGLSSSSGLQGAPLQGQPLQGVPLTRSSALKSVPLVPQPSPTLLPLTRRGYQ